MIIRLRAFRRVIFYFLLIWFCFLSVSGGVLANTCTGSRSYTYNRCSCKTDDETLEEYCDCEIITNNLAICQWMSEGTWCGYCYKADDSCSVVNGVCSVHANGGVPCGGAMPGMTGCSVCVTVNGRCGGSNGGSFCDRPTNHLCNAGSLSWTDSIGR